HQGSNHAKYFWSDHHYGGLSANPHAPGRRGKNVRADGSDGLARATGRDDFLSHLCSGRDLHLARQETWRKGERFHAGSETFLRAAARPSVAQTRSCFKRRDHRAGAELRAVHATWRRIHSDARCRRPRSRNLPRRRYRNGSGGKNAKTFRGSLTSLPEVQLAFGRLGTAEVATDPMSPNQGDEFVILKPEKEWPNPKKPKAQLIEELDEAVKQVVGTGVEIEQPVQLRANELISGVKSDMAVKIFGDDLELLRATAEKIRALLAKIRGAVEPKVQQVEGLPLLTIQLKRDELARYGLSVGDVQDVVEMAIGGKNAGEVFEGDRRFPLVV